MKRRIYTIMLLAVYLVQTALYSCAKKENNANSLEHISTNEVTTTQDDLSDRNFNGEIFKIIGSNGALNNFPDNELTGDSINDALYEREISIEDKFNINIEYIVMDGGVPTTMLEKSVLAQENEYDMLVDPATSICKITSSGVLYDLNEVPYLSLDNNWWSRLVAKNCHVDGKLYYVCGDIMPVIYTIPGCIFMNNKMAEDYGITKNAIYQDVLDGKWTLEMLISLTKDANRDLNSDDIIDSSVDFIGYLSLQGELAAGVLAVGSDISLSSYDNSRAIKVDLMTERVLSLISKATPMFTEYKTNTDSTAFHETFKSDRAIFAQHYTSSAYTRYRDMESDFSILPMPKLDEEQETYLSLMNPWGAAFVAVPSNADTDKVGFLMEAMARYSYENLRYVVYEEAFKLKGARDDESAKMLDLIFDNLYIDLNGIYNFGGSMTLLSNAIFNGDDFVSAYAGISTIIQADIDSIVSKTK